MVPAGHSFGRYEIVRPLGRGGMGTVFLAHDPTLERPVAIKVLEDTDTGESRTRVLREARAASALNHPNICTIYEIGDADGRAFIAMEYVDGSAVADMAPLPLQDAVRYGVEAADALAHAHDRGVVHGDLKAANALLTTSGRLKVVDFGLARRVASPASEQTRSLGTPALAAGTPYAMAPELVRGGGADLRSDVWGLGVLLFEMLSGAKPFDAPALADLFSAILRDASAPLPPHVPPAVKDIVQKCLAKNPGHRYQRAADVRLVLEVVASSLRRTDRTPSGTAVVAGDALPLPPIVAASSAGAFVGRTREIDQLQLIWARVESGHRQLVLLAGEPGIGKTRLSMAFARAVGEQGATVLVGRCDEEGLVPYQPLVEALTWYARTCAESDLRAHLASAGGGSELVQLVPDLLRRQPDLAPPALMSAESQRYRLFEAVSEFLAAAASVRPLLLVLEDLHWADKPTLLMVRHLVRAQQRTPLCLVCSYRESELGRTHPLAEMLADLRREPIVTRLSLRGLAESDVRDLVRSIVGLDGLGLAAHVGEITGGNPFFVGEILRHVRESGAMAEWNAAPSSVRAAQVTLPEGIRDVIGRRLSRTSDACNRVLTSAAVVGREFDTAVLETLGDVPDEQLLDALDEAVAAQLVAEAPGRSGRFTFMHALIRETLYSELSSSRRARLHRRVGEALERLAQGKPNPPLADLAHHFCQAASATDSEKAVDYASRAGDRAADALAFEEAARLYEMALQALDLCDNPDAVRRVDLHTRRANAFGGLAMWALKKREVELALASLGPDQPERRSELTLMLADSCFYLLDTPGVRRFATEGLALAEQTGQADLAADALGWLARCHQADGDVESAVETDRAAIGRGGGRKGIAVYHGPHTLYLAGRIDEAVAAGARAADRARTFRDSEFSLYALSHYGLALGASGRYDEAFRVFEEARAFGRKCGVLPPTARAMAMQAGMHLAVFDLDGAEQLQWEARELALSVAFPPTSISAAIDLLLTSARRHDPGAVEALLVETETAAAQTPGWHEWLWKLRLRQARAELAFARGDFEQAIADATSSVDQSQRRHRPKYEALGLVTRAAAAHRIGRTRDAIADATAAIEVARRSIDPALELRAIVMLLEVEGSDEWAASARALVAKIRAALPNDTMTRRFDASEVVTRAMK